MLSLPSSLLSIALVALGNVSGGAAEAKHAALQTEPTVTVTVRLWETRVSAGRGSKRALAHYRAAKADKSDRGFRACIAQAVEDGDPLGEAVCSLDVVESLVTRHQDRPWAEEKQRRAAELFATELGEKNSARGLALCNVGNFESYRAANAEAMTSYQLALSIQEALLVSGHRELADTLTGLAIVTKKDDPAKAETILRRALAIRKGLKPSDPKAVVGALLSLADIRHQQRDVKGALAFCTEAAALARKEEGADSLVTANALIKAGFIHRKEENWAEALEVLEPGFRIQMSRLSSADGEIGYTATQLAFAHQGLKNFDKAHELLALTLTVHQQSDGIHAPTVAETRENLAYLELYRGNAKEAVGHAREAVKIREMNDSPKLHARSLDCLALAEWTARDLEGAGASCSKATALLKGAKEADNLKCTKQLLVPR